MVAMPRPMAVPDNPELHGKRVKLEPFIQEHIPALLKIGQDTPAEFQLTSTPVNQAEADAYYGVALKARAAGTAFPFTISLQATGELVGMSRFNSLDFGNRNTEIGYTWFRPDQYGTATNVETKLLMLGFAFEQLLLHRVSLRTDVDNHRSRQAILALGAREEGVMRRHMLKRDGSLRDTVVYAITDLDWPEVKAHNLRRLERKLAAG